MIYFLKKIKCKHTKTTHSEGIEQLSQVVKRIFPLVYYSNTMEESQVDTGALPETVSQQGEDQRRNRTSQTTADAQLPEHSNEPGRQWQPQNAQANTPNVEEKQSTIITRQPAGGEAAQSDPSHNAEVT